MSFRALCLAAALTFALSASGVAAADSTDDAAEGRGPSKRRKSPRRDADTESEEAATAGDGSAEETSGEDAEAPEPSEDAAENEAPDAGDTAAPESPQPANEDRAKEGPAEGAPAPAEEEAPSEEPAKGTTSETPAKKGSPSDPPAGDTPPEEEPAEDAPGDDGPPEEKPSEPDAPDDVPEEPSKPEPPPPPIQKPPEVELKSLSFVGGEVVRAERFLKRSRGELAKCVHAHGGVGAAEGVLSMQLLVRSRGRAEGVEVLARRHVSERAGRCVRRLLKGRWMGSPSQDPVGVTFRLVFGRRLAE